MPENPLLPHKKLKELHALMQRCRELDRKLPAGPARAAMLAAAAIHLLPGDVLCGSASDATARALTPPPRRNDLAAGKSVPVSCEAALPANVSRLALCAAMACGLRAAGAGGLVLVLAQAGPGDPASGKPGSGDWDWPEALAYAQRAQAPLILLCGDATEGRVNRSSARRTANRRATVLSWTEISKVAKKLKLPVLPVDGEDAVAVYRVVQECAGRARMGEGPAVVWCALTPQRARLGRSAQPLARLESYLAVRGLATAIKPGRERC